MTTASISKKDAKALYEFCEKYKIEEFYFAKDHGAYFGATKGSQKAGDFENYIIYLTGMNPKENDNDWYDAAGAKFGYDDFGIHLPVQWLNVFLFSPSYAGKHRFSIQITDSKVELI